MIRDAPAMSRKGDLNVARGPNPTLETPAPTRTTSKLVQQVQSLVVSPMPFIGGTLHWRCLTARLFLLRSQAVPHCKNGLSGTFREQYNSVRFGEPRLLR